MAFLIQNTGAQRILETDPNFGLPAYSSSPPSAPNSAAPVTATRERAQHRYTIQDKKGHDWASLFLQSSAPSGKHLPTFLEGENIVGSVNLNLKKEETIRYIEFDVSEYSIGFTA
jgi:hypothetical protein